MKFSKLFSGLSSAWQSIGFGNRGSDVRVVQPRPLSQPDRREFLKILGLAAAGSAVVYSFPSIIVPKNIEPVTLGMRGLPYLINGSGDYFGISRVTNADVIAAQREYMKAMIETTYQRESNWQRRMQEPANFRGRRVPLVVAPDYNLRFPERISLT